MDRQHTVFDVDQLPSRRLYIKSTVVDRFARGVGEMVVVQRERVARAIADKCSKDENLVQMSFDGPVMNLTADCIILTQDELADLMRQQFKAGMKHATQFNGFEYGAN